jgi:hypothetical protein
MIFKLIAKDTYCLTKMIDTEDYPNSDGRIDTLLEIETYNLQKEYGKKYGETCGEVIVEEVNDEECSGNKLIMDSWKKECNSDSDEVFEGEAEALNKLYRNAGLPVEDSEPTDDQSLDKILEKDVEDTSMEEILKIADHLDKQGGES